MPYSAKKVYLIHGWATNCHVFDDLISRLLAGWDVRVLDLPERDDAPFTEPFDITAVAEAFTGRIDTPAYILGWSLGELVALYLIALYPDKIRSLCLTAGFARLAADTDYPEGLAQPALGKMVGTFQQDYAKHIKRFLQLQLLHTSHSNKVLDRMLPDSAHCGTSSTLQATLEAVNCTDARLLLSLIRTPLLLAFGQKDAITLSRMDGYLHRHLGNSELVLTDKAAHAPFLSRADEFTEIYRDFVEKTV